MAHEAFRSSSPYSKYTVCSRPRALTYGVHRVPESGANKLHFGAKFSELWDRDRSTFLSLGDVTPGARAHLAVSLCTAWKRIDLPTFPVREHKRKRQRRQKLGANSRSRDPV